ncbi:MAG: T9SS type A sorting domain-containing protein [Bacteroidia bacterium]|nr:T9SS type A sorting domain-containing protein [Bacteroidia bacterium]
MRFITFIILISTLTIGNLSSQTAGQAYINAQNCIGNDCVYPGDANNDGLVNRADVLTLGWGYGKTGPSRSTAGINWAPSYCPDWITSTPDSLNNKYLDCNGDGTINSNDLDAISQNYSLSYLKYEIVSQYEGDLEFYLELNTDTFIEGDTIIAKLMLGTELNQAEDIYGFSVALSYPEHFVKDDGVSGDFMTSWLIDNGEIGFYRDFPQSGVVEVVLSRIDQTPVSGYGQIGEMYFIIEDNLDEKGFGDINLNFSTGSGLVSTTQIYSLDVDASTEVVISNSEKPTVNNWKPSDILAYPTPFVNGVYLDGIFPLKEDLTFHIYNINGQEIKKGVLKSNHIPLEGLNNGVYILTINGTDMHHEIKIIK